MTPKERAEDLIRRFDEPVRDVTNYRVQAMISMAEEAITAAVEEKREECAKIAEQHEKSEMVKAKTAERLDKKWEEAGHLFEANSARFIAAEIRKPDGGTK